MDKKTKAKMDKINRKLKALRATARAEGWTKQRLMTERGKILKEGSR